MPVTPIRPLRPPSHPALYAALRALTEDERAGRIAKLTPPDFERVAGEHGVDLDAIIETLDQLAADRAAEAGELRIYAARRARDGVQE